MKWFGILSLAIAVNFGLKPAAYSFTTFGEEPGYSFNCGYSSITASYSATRARYNIVGACLQLNTQINTPFTAEGAFDQATGNTAEQIILNGPSPFRGTLRSSMVCVGLRENLDPWLTKVSCGQGKLNAQGDVASRTTLIEAMLKEMNKRGSPMTATFPYDRNVLLAKRDADLKAEAAARAAEEQRNRELSASAGQKPAPLVALMSPVIQSPTAGQRFLNQTAIPIKLAPPKSWSVSNYIVNLHRKNPQGQWIAHTTIPVGAAQAHSAAGYTGFGAGGPDGRSLAFLTAPGTWRLSAQVSQPKQSGWSDWVEFNVMAPPSPTSAKKGVSGGWK